ncbi:MAG: DUF473 domain-containing protein [Methanoregulaceae archaeon]|nr:DUF473 domain-containing protein [Methanoregulaceae archaeon]
MECSALTGISPQVIRELKLGKPRTLELQSAHNIVTLAGIEPGASVFMTSVDMDDLGPGDVGIIVEVLSLAIVMKRIVEIGQGSHFEERERVSARIQVRSLAAATVKSASHEGMVRPTTVDVVKACCFHAG